jgi:hypothetical protein
MALAPGAVIEFRGAAPRVCREFGGFRIRLKQTTGNQKSAERRAGESPSNLLQAIAAESRAGEDKQQGNLEVIQASFSNMFHEQFSGSQGALARNGGMMAETQQEQKAVNTKKKISRSTKGKAKAGTSKTLAEPSRKSRSRVDGAEKLRQAADRLVGEHSEELADLLTRKAVKGDLASARVLVALAEHKKPLPEPAKKRRGRAAAILLSEESGWAVEAQTENNEPG